MKIREEHVKEIEKIIACGDSILDGIIHETMTIKASGINNCGCLAQIKFLIEEGVYEDSEQVLEYIKVCYES